MCLETTVDGADNVDKVSFFSVWTDTPTLLLETTDTSEGADEVSRRISNAAVILFLVRVIAAATAVFAKPISHNMSAFGSVDDDDDHE